MRIIPPELLSGYNDSTAIQPRFDNSTTSLRLYASSCGLLHCGLNK